MSPIYPSKPPSPPHSIDGDAGRGDNKRCVTQKVPYTPPRSVQAAQMVDSSLERYEDPSMYQIAPTQFYYNQQPTFTRTMQYQTPPAAMGDPSLQTKSMRVLGSPLSPSNTGSSRRSRSPRQKRAPRNRTAKRGGPMLDKPLSVLTKDYKLPVRDMKAWVHRPVEERLNEVEKRKGYIARPMNSFMLYRSAYAERVKQFCKENNHQVVSQVTGASWPLEPQEIRDMYEQFACTERDNHAAAHPGYKFAPNKNGKKRNQADDGDDVSDGDPDWEGSSRSAKRSNTSRHGDSRSGTVTPFHHDEMRQYAISHYQATQMHPSSYHFNNPNGPAPMMMGANDLHNYYQASVVPYGQHVDDVKFGKIEDDYARFDMNMPLVGMPDNENLDLLALQPAIAGQDDTAQVNVLDPRLGRYDTGYQYVHHEGSNRQFEMPRNFEYPEFHGQHQMVYADQAYHPGMATLTDQPSTWSEAGQPGNIFEGEFQKWT